MASKRKRAPSPAPLAGRVSEERRAILDRLAALDKGSLVWERGQPSGRNAPTADPADGIQESAAIQMEFASRQILLRRLKALARAEAKIRSTALGLTRPGRDAVVRRRSARVKASGKRPPMDETPARPIDLNAARRKDLTQLPRIGADKARRIVRYRAVRKGFRDWSDFARTPGITEADLEAIRGRARIGPRPDGGRAAPDRRRQGREMVRRPQARAR
jgi:DNA uptake protein ComE-like DNA-binding protein